MSLKKVRGEMSPVNTKPVLEHEVELRERLVRLRRQIHANPEDGFREVETAALIARTARELGANVREGVAKTGVIAELGTGSPIVAIRADMDALPVSETTGLEFASQVPNMMHACGHDRSEERRVGIARRSRRLRYR